MLKVFTSLSADRKQLITDEGNKMTKEECEIETSKAIMEMRTNVAKLEKEKAKLQEKLNIRSCQNCKHNNRSCPNDGSCVNYSKWESYINPELTKAKEIIKKFLEFVNNEVDFDSEHPQEHTDLWNELCEEAEQFISEVEK